MAKLRLCFTLLHHILFIPFVLPLAFAAAEQTIWRNYCDSVYGTYTTNGTYSNNLNSVLTKMTSTDSNFGFYNLSVGDDSGDVAYLISLCIGNLPVSDCHTCQNRIKIQINSMCPNQKTAIYWSDDCMVRYSSKPILATVEKSPNFVMTGNLTIDSSETTNYNNFVGSLVNSLPEKASKGNSSLKFATAQGVFDLSITIYSAAQCTPELAQNDCLECLNSAVRELESQDSGQRGARYLFPSCFVRYEEYKFYLSSDGDSTDNTNIGRSNRKIKIIAASVAGGLVVLLVVMACFIFLRKRKLHWSILSNRLMDGDDISIIESFQFNFSIIRAATGNFSEANKLGEGGFGAVYQGLLPDNKQEIAVKRLAGNSVQGENEFKTEVTLLAKLQHRNLVRLLGFSFHDKERLLIYEFVANASLDHFLFDATRHTHLNWETRYKIIRGIARGILYLHEDSRLRIIHRDLKASNVLLDAEMCPKIADFGTARLFDIDQTHSNTRRIVGTYGYMAPEYVLHGNFSTKSDVYSFGVLLLEIICGKRCSTVYTGEFSGSLISLIWRKWSEGVPLDVIDSSISDGSESQILRCIHIGLLCVQDNMVDRPTMSSVVLMMSSESLALSLPSHPAYINTLNMPLNTTDANWLNDKSTDLESITELHVR